MTTSSCPKCGTPLELNRSEPCPVCLLQLAVQADSVFGSSAQSGCDAQSEHKVSASAGIVPDLAQVQRAFPQLEIFEQIGRGGMGTVFKARQSKLDRFVALKILSEQLAEKPTFAERFAQEGKLLARLNHPNIVVVYDFGQAETIDETGNSLSFFFLILEYVDGVNLRQAMREERFTPEQALAIVPKICEALQYAHEEGVLHRDIKPENILLDTKGRIKIADFGIASVARWTTDGAAAPLPKPAPDGRWNLPEERLTQTGVVLGTPSYMAPEQLATPGAVDHRADIYSLGVVFYELLTGELPRESLGQWTPPSEKTPVGAEIDGIVLKALNRDRNQRHQSAEELKTEIETATIVPPKADKSFMQFVEQQGLRLQIGMIGTIIAAVGIFYLSEVSTERSLSGFITKLFLILFLIFLGIDVYLRYKKFLGINQTPDKSKSDTKSSTGGVVENSLTVKNFSLKKIWKNVINEVKNWPIWATILVCCAAFLVVPTLLWAVFFLVIIVGVIVIGLPVFLFGDTFEALYSLFKEASLPDQMAITGGIIVILCLIAVRYRKKWQIWRNKKESGSTSENLAERIIRLLTKVLILLVLLFYLWWFSPYFHIFPVK